MRYSSLILSAMLIINFTACNKGGKENDIAHETPISEVTTVTIGSTETTSTAQITSAMSTKPITTVTPVTTTIQTESIKPARKMEEVFPNYTISSNNWFDLFGIPEPFRGKTDGAQMFFMPFNWKFINFFFR